MEESTTAATETKVKKKGGFGEVEIAGERSHQFLRQALRFILDVLSREGREDLIRIMSRLSYRPNSRQSRLS